MISGSQDQEDLGLTLIRNIVARRAGIDESRVLPESRLLHDLGFDGDEAEALLLEIADQFHVSLKGFQFQKFFGGEARYWNPLWMLRHFRQRHLDAKEPLTVRDIASAVASGALGSAGSQRQMESIHQTNLGQ